MPSCPSPKTSSARRTAPRDVLAPESDRWAELVARFADRARRFGYGLVLTPIFEHAEVFHRVGIEHRRCQQGDVRVRRPRRAAARAATGRNRVGRARVRAAPPAGAVEVLVHRAQLPRRAAAEGPLPPALPSGRRGPRRRRPRCRRRSDRAARRVPARPRAHEVPRAAQLDGRRREPGAVPPGSPRLPARPLRPRR